MRLARSVAGTAAAYGYVLDVGADLVLIANEVDFALDGWYVFPIADVTEVRSGPIERTHERWMREDGLLDCLHPAFDVDLSDWSTVFATLRRARCVVAAEKEHPEDEDYVLGRIARVNRRSVGINFIDPRGRAWWTPTKLRYDEITCLHFGDRYTTVIGRHETTMPKCPVCGRERGDAHDALHATDRQ